MADPQLTYHYRALAVFQLKTGLAEDRFVNSFAFRSLSTPDVPEEAAERIARKLDEFYCKPPSGVSGALASFMPNTIEFLEYRIYHLGQPPPRPPMILEPLPTPAFSSSQPLPYQVAAVLTLHTAVRSRAGRGRLYLGPFIQTMASVGDNRTVIGSSHRQRIVGAAQALYESGEDMQWGIISRDEGFLPVTGGYVDDGWDTQRRRATAGANRLPFAGGQTGGAVLPRT